MRVAAAFVFALLVPSAAFAQDPPPKIGPFVVDVHGSIPKFPEDQLLADSRGMTLAELPGRGLGVQVGAHVYFFRYKAVTFGAGGEFAKSHASSSPLKGQETTVRSAEETFTSFAPQLSFNFGTGNGWSYLSGGLARSKWSVIPDGQAALPGDTEPLKTINYGGGARWFFKDHLAFSFDVRFYAINPGPPSGEFPGSPRTTLLVIGAGISVR